MLEAIHAKYGYDLRGYAADSMQRRVHAALAQSGPRTSASCSTGCCTSPQLFASVLDELTVQVSEMFRDPRFYRAFREQRRAAPAHLPAAQDLARGLRHGRGGLRDARSCSRRRASTSAPRSTPPTSARGARAGPRRHLPGRARCEVRRELRGSGRQACASKTTTRSPTNASRCDELLRRNVVFFQHDLVCDHALGEMHVIFCRNVLIYFGDALRANGAREVRARPLPRRLPVPRAAANAARDHPDSDVRRVRRGRAHLPPSR